MTGDEAGAVRALALSVLSDHLGKLKAKIAAGAPTTRAELDHVLAVARAFAAGGGKLPRARDVASPGKGVRAVFEDLARTIPEVRDVLKVIEDEG